MSSFTHRASALIRRALFCTVPEERKDSFRAYCLRQNIGRFSVLPFLNILTQVLCHFIYLHVSPQFYLRRAPISEHLLLRYSALYIVGNLAIFALLRIADRKRKTRLDIRFGERVIFSFMLLYIISEAVSLLFEMQMAGNIYRFLATFFVVCFLPVVSHLQKFGLITLYYVLASISLAQALPYGEQSPLLGFLQLLSVFYIACVFVSMLLYTHTVRSYTRNQGLVEANEHLQTLNAQLTQLSVTDPLTQLPNRRAFDDFLERSWSDCKRAQRPMSLLMIDVDHFKAYNDNFGHQMGDECLRQVAACLESKVNRSGDMCARYGGEEFAVIMPFCDGDAARDHVENIRRSVEALQIPNPASSSGPFITISVGFACVQPTKNQSYDEIIHLADNALYEAKKRGRNCVVYVTQQASEVVDDLSCLAVRTHEMEAVRLAEIRRLVASEIAEYIFYYNQESDTGYFSPGFMRDFDLPYSEPDQVRPFLKRIIHPQDYRALMRRIYEAKNSGFFSTTLRVLSPTKGLFWVDCRMNVQYSSKGKPLWIIGSFTDVHERVTHTQITELLYEGLPVSIMIYNYSRDHMSFSPQLLEELPLQTNTCTSGEWRALLLPQDLSLYEDAYTRMRASGGIFEAQYRIQGKDSVLLVSCQGQAAFDEQENPLFLVASIALCPVEEEVLHNDA